MRANWSATVAAGSLILAVLAFAAAAAGTGAAPSPFAAVDLGTLGGATSSAVAVNNDGQVVGNSAIAGDTATHAFSWTEETGMVDLGTLGGTFSEARAVNNEGDVVGASSTANDGALHATMWR